jgi:hypothetical protein
MSFSSTKLDKRAEQILAGSEGGGGRGEKMAQTMYTHTNKCINNLKNKKRKKSFSCRHLVETVTWGL